MTSQTMGGTPPGLKFSVELSPRSGNFVESPGRHSVKSGFSGTVIFTMDFRDVIRVRAGLSGMSDCILHLPQVYLSHLKNSYVGKMFEHRSDLVPSTRKESVIPGKMPARNTNFEQNTL